MILSTYTVHIVLNSDVPNLTYVYIYIRSIYGHCFEALLFPFLLPVFPILPTPFTTVGLTPLPLAELPVPGLLLSLCAESSRGGGCGQLLWQLGHRTALHDD